MWKPESLLKKRDCECKINNNNNYLLFSQGKYFCKGNFLQIFCCNVMQFGCHGSTGDLSTVAIIPDVPSFLSAVLFCFAVLVCLDGSYKNLIPNSYPKPGIINCQCTYFTLFHSDNYYFGLTIIFFLTQRAVGYNLAIKGNIGLSARKYYQWILWMSAINKIKVAITPFCSAGVIFCFIRRKIREGGKRECTRLEN